MSIWSHGYFAEAALAFTFSVGLVGCETAADQQQKANEAQAQANLDRARAAQDLKGDRTQATRDMREAQNAADRKIVAAQAEFSQMREDFRHDLQTQLVALDKDVEVLQIRSRTMTGKAKADVNAALPRIDEARSDLNAAIEQLNKSSAATWDDSKTVVEREFAELKDLVLQASTRS